MGIQNNFNNGLFQVAQIATLAQINQTLKKFGCSSIKDLESKINDIEILIANNKDQGLKTDNLEQLLFNYMEIRDSYYKKLRDDMDRKKSTTCVSILLLTVAAIIAFGLLVYYL